MKYCFGVDIGGTTVKLGVFEEEGKNIDKWEIPTYTENEGARILPDIAASIKAKMEEHNIAKEDITFKDAIKIAEDMIDSGKAKEKLEKFIELSKQY